MQWTYTDTAIATLFCCVVMLVVFVMTVGSMVARYWSDNDTD